jgi:hypothetical protein
MYDLRLIQKRHAERFARIDYRNLFQVCTIKARGSMTRPLSVKMILKIEIKIAALEKDKIFLY